MFFGNRFRVKPENRWFHLIVCVIFFFAVQPAAVAQEERDLETISASALLSEATRMLSDQQYLPAIPYLEKYLERMAVIDDARVLALMQEVRLKLGRIMVYLEDPISAAEYFEQYTERLPCYKPREAYKLLAVSLYESGEYEKSIMAVTNALARPLPRLLEKEETTVNLEELSEEEMGGLTLRQIKRYAKEVEKGDAVELEEISSDVPDPEPDFSTEDLVLLNMTLAEAYAELEEWQESVEPFKFVVENAEAADQRGYATMKLIDSLVALEDFDEAKGFILQLSKTDARYDIRVNMALMNTAIALYNAGEYDSALLLYRMVLPRKALVEHQTQKMNEIRRAEGMPDVELTIVTNETGRIETLFGNKYADLVSQQGQPSQAILSQGKPMALIELEESVGTLVSLPPYEDDLLYRKGQLYASVGRPFEAAAALEAVFLRDPIGDRGQRAFYEYLQVLTDPLEEYEQVETLALQYLKDSTRGISPRQVAHALTGAYQRQERWEAIKELRPVIEGFYPSNDDIVQKFECELYYMQAIADLMLLNYKEAQAVFEAVLRDFPASHQEDNVTYWHAMTRLFMQEYQASYDEFEAYAVQFPRGNWIPEAAFRGGICLFGMEKNDQAQDRFTYVIENYPKSSVFADALSLRADLLAAKGMLDEAQKDYQEAFQSAQNERQAGYATFQMASMFELEERYEEILNAVNTYLERYDDEADVAKAAYWIGKTKLAQGLIGEAVDAYLDAVVGYGDDIRQDGVDLIINELVNISRRLKETELADLKTRLDSALTAAEDPTLILRLRVLRAKLDQRELELGKELIAELPDLNQAPPPVLAVICDASFEAEDYSRAEEILTLFLGRFEDSDFMRSAYKLRGYDLFEAGQYEEAMKLIEETQALYGTDPDAAWAQLMKGRIELLQGELDEARATFRAILTVRDWRGVPYAEATYRLGEAEEAAGDLTKAFAWYQRTYFQYKGHAGGYWAAEGYLASARCLRGLGRENDVRNTYRAMLFDKYVNTLPQAETAREALGAEEVLEIRTMMDQGIQTNITVSVEADAVE